ncbi:CBS domain-containing protein [Streptomonospora sp. PA3]|uniref:CBS domain-containing protein n=1 Tax=Streptomonospora sp. PA3 TaxID=2607326 RepID=UPI0012DDCCCB|nr:CBS domain-containing protein [Streptomonospora sp. PA3]MUL41540.1 CBS domain-containing protein [Streptomonospora sp. PA3]
MLVHEMMSVPEVLLTPDTPVREAARLLAETRCDSAPVVRSDGALAGVLTESDLLTDHFDADEDAFARGLSEAPAPAVHNVGAAMTRAVVTASEGEDACALSRRMFETHIRCVPVLRSGTVVGVVRRRDVMCLVLRPDADIRADVHAAIGRRVPEAQGLKVTVHDGTVEIIGPAAPPARRTIAELVQQLPGVRTIEFSGPSASVHHDRADQQTSAADAV